MGRMAQIARNWSDAQKSTFLEQAAKTVADARVRFSSWSVKNQVDCCVLRYTCLMLNVLPEFREIAPVEKGKIWSTDVLKTHAHFLLPFQLELRRKKDKSYPCARTLYRWFYSYVTAIASFGYDPIDGQLAGTVLLINGGLYNLLAAQVEERSLCLSSLSLSLRHSLKYVPVVVNFSLRRELKPIVLFGLPELQLMIEEILLNSASSGRHMAIMKIAEWLVLLFCAARPSSLGPCNPEMVKHGKASSLRLPPHDPMLTSLALVRSLEARLLRQGERRRVLLRTPPPTPQLQGTSLFSLPPSRHSHSTEQGFNQGKAGIQNFCLTSPELPQHVMFDLPTMMLLYFFQRGVLPSNLRTWDDVLQSEVMEIHVREEVRDEPL